MNSNLARGSATTNSNLAEASQQERNARELCDRATTLNLAKRSATDISNLAKRSAPGQLNKYQKIAKMGLKSGFLEFSLKNNATESILTTLNVKQVIWVSSTGQTANILSKTCVEIDF